MNVASIKLMLLISDKQRESDISYSLNIGVYHVDTVSAEK
jgi:hypothetical protein